MRLVILSYDFASRNPDRSEAEWKLVRDGYAADTKVLIITWRKKRETILLSPNITIEALPLFAGAFRPLYDLLTVFLAPHFAKKHQFKPDRISAGEWPLAVAAAALRFYCGGEVVVRLIGLPRHIAKTRGLMHLWYTAFCERIARSLPDRVIAINDATAQYALERGMSRKCITILPLDSIRADQAYVEQAQKGLARRELGIVEDVPLILSVGRLAAEKAYPELIAVFGKCNLDARLVIIGEGELRPKLEAQAAKDAPGKVLFAGKKKRSEIWNYFADADAFALLSISEGLGLVFWEAMYAGVPVIGRPIGGIQETIGENGLRGFFWNSSDGVEVFRKSLERCFAGGPEVEAMKKRARSYVEAQLLEMAQERQY